MGWLAGPGFAALAEDCDWDWRSAAEFRSRHLIGGLARLLAKG